MQTQRQVAANPQTMPIHFGCESACRLMPSTLTVAIYYYYYYDPHWFYRPTVNGKLSRHRHCRMCSACSSLHIAVAVIDMNIWILGYVYGGCSPWGSVTTVVINDGRGSVLASLTPQSDMQWRFGVTATALGPWRSYSTSSPVSTRMGDCLRSGKPPPYVTSHQGQLSLLPSAVPEMCTCQCATMLCGWE